MKELVEKVAALYADFSKDRVFCGLTEVLK